VRDQRSRLLVAALGFAGLPRPSYDRALWALRTWLDSWAGIGLSTTTEAGAHLPHHGNGAFADERDGHRAGAHAVARDAAGRLGGAEAGGWLSRTRNLGVPLVLPEGEAVLVQTNRPPIIRAHQAHPFSGRDCDAATIAGLPEAGSVPQFNRAVTRKDAIFNPLSNALSNCIWSHAIARMDISALRINRHLDVGARDVLLTIKDSVDPRGAKTK
jgi:hypothetical protein